MPVAVVRIRKMRVDMGERLMPMTMIVPRARRCLPVVRISLVCMFVMIIAHSMLVFMRVRKGRMRMFVQMALG